MSTLGLGSAQFGMPYGVSNPRGQTSHHQLVAILELAARSGVKVIDTAALYGESETALGAAMPQGAEFHVVTKTARFSGDPANAVAEVRQTVERSLANLQRPHVYGLLVHNADDLLGAAGSAIWTELEEVRREGLVEKLGVSVYTGEQIEHVIDRYLPDIVQVPLNVFDQRLVESGQLDDLVSRGIEVHARSVFLQGLLLMDPAELPPYFEPYRARIRRYAEAVEEAGSSRIEAALGFAKSLDAIETVLVGVTRARELEEILNAWNAPAAKFNYAQFAISEPALVDPSRWRLEATSA